MLGMRQEVPIADLLAGNFLAGIYVKRQAKDKLGICFRDSFYIRSVLQTLGHFPGKNR